jgi:hypothetical protein
MFKINDTSPFFLFFLSGWLNGFTKADCPTLTPGPKVSTNFFPKSSAHHGDVLDSAFILGEKAKETL